MAKPHNKKPAPYWRYASLGIQMVLVIGFSGWLGYLIDKQLQWQLPVFLITFVLVALGVQLYKLYRETTSNP